MKYLKKLLLGSVIVTCACISTSIAAAGDARDELAGIIDKMHGRIYPTYTWMQDQDYADFEQLFAPTGQIAMLGQDKPAEQLAATKAWLSQREADHKAQQ